jgi:hypothetical protein
METLTMAPANFHSRLQRIQEAQERMEAPAAANFRAQGVAGVAAVRAPKRRRRSPIREHLSSTLFGLVLGCLLAVGLIGLTQDGSLWGPGSKWHALAYYPIMGGLAMTPVLMILSLVMAARKPAFALFSLGYLSGVVIPMFI